MHRSLASRIAVVLGCALVLASAPAPAQTLVSHFETTSFSSGLPEDTGSSWARVGTGHALLVEGGLLLNDNSPASVIAYQGLLGRIEAAHDVVFRGEVQVLSNIGGEAAIIEISRPGMEIEVQLFPDGIVVMEREGREPARWLGSAPADLTAYSEVEVHKTSNAGPGPERVLVSVNGRQILEAEPKGVGDMDLGRVLFGSLGHADFGASIWRWVEVQAEFQQQKTPNVAASIGQLKSRF